MRSTQPKDSNGEESTGTRLKQIGIVLPASAKKKGYSGTRRVLPVSPAVHVQRT